MAYTDTNFKTKKAFREAVAAGKQITIYSPGPFPVPTNGRVAIEGPHGYHTWYADCDITNGVITKVR